MRHQQIVIRGKLGAVTRHHPADLDAADELRRELKASLAEDYINELVDTPPTLTDPQRLRLASLLVSTPGVTA